ncbi:MAG: CHAT domain-containing tetratricopeptide repeat protein, partial [Oscillatoria sp. PMC 1068.18]|nr:CHAT domain-containing tetratricopeptide repeat protein [Oscillatoria sp. PMC 1068.18]
KLLGEEHPDVATSLNNLAVLLVSTDRQTEALEKMQEALEVDDRLMRRTFAASSERDRLIFLQQIRNNFELFLSLVYNYFSDSPEVIKAALDVVLSRKAVTAAALAAQNEALYSGRYPELTEKLTKLRSLSDQIVHLTYTPPEPEAKEEYQQQLSNLQIEYDNLQRDLAAKVPEIQLQETAVDRRAVALELPEGSKLVEFVCTRIWNFKARQWQPDRYLAFILPAGEPEAVSMVDLGEASHCDKLIRVFRGLVSLDFNNLGSRLDLWDDESESTNLEFLSYDPTEARELAKVILEPLQAAVGNCKHLLISPDGALNLVPFQILPLEDTGEKILMDEYEISYLSVGRDVLRWRTKTNRPAAASLILADPDFDYPHANTSAKSEEKKDRPQVMKLSGMRFTRAPGTRLLGESVAKILQTKAYLDREALESHLTKGNCPKILLIATHGYFEGEIQQEDYLKLIRQLIQCPAGEEGKILANNRKLVDRRLVDFMETVASRIEDETVASWLRDLAAKLATELDAETTTTQPIFLNRPGEFNHRFATVKVENPMLRSGVALAGANTWLAGAMLPPKAGKGFLFAQDVAGLDLWANEVTVLSACETGMGDVALGEGVFGLRRAFAVAGAKTLVMSLWSVGDRATALLMRYFFTNLAQGMGRADALKAAQNRLRNVTVAELRRSDLGLGVLRELVVNENLLPQDALSCQESERPLQHPFFWGAWVCQGDTTAFN